MAGATTQQNLGKGAHPINLHILSMLLRSAIRCFLRKFGACSGASLGTFDFAPGQPQLVLPLQRPTLHYRADDDDDGAGAGASASHGHGVRRRREEKEEEWNEETECKGS